MQIRIRLFTVMGIRIRILLLFKVYRPSTDLFWFEPPRLECERPWPSRLHASFWAFWSSRSPWISTINRIGIQLLSVLRIRIRLPPKKCRSGSASLPACSKSRNAVFETKILEKFFQGTSLPIQSRGGRSVQSQPLHQVSNILAPLLVPGVLQHYCRARLSGSRIVLATWCSPWAVSLWQHHHAGGYGQSEWVRCLRYAGKHSDTASGRGSDMWSADSSNTREKVSSMGERKL